MTINSKMRFAPRPKVLFLTALSVLAFAEGVSAFATGGAEKSGQTGSCAFSLQLQTSYEAKRMYMVGIEQTSGNRTSQGSSQMWAMLKPGGSGDDSDPGTSYPGTSYPGTSYQSTSFAGATYARATGISGLDPFSTECLSCHDGVGAADIGVDLRNRPNERTSRVSSFTSEHPLGMDYSKYVAAGRGYKHVFGDSKVLLINGKVGCLSCHDPLNPGRGHLVKTDRSTSVCHSCHDK